jgi:glycosyltransferase involved in cell wall biosynthesis
MESKQPIDIVLTTWKREWMTLAAIEALKLNTQTPYRLIIIDNGSNPNVQEVYNSRSDIYIKLDRNYGLEYAKNLGMKFVESEYFVSMDNDILVYKYEPDWLSQLVSLMENHSNYGAISLKPQILVGTGMSMFQTTDEIVPFHHVPGYARIMRTELVNRVGAWNNKREGRGHEEIWIGDKFEEVGSKMAWANNIKCWHLFGKEDTDDWGYPKDMTPEDSGHQPVWPMPKNDLEEIERGVGIKLG